MPKTKRPAFDDSKAGRPGLDQRTKDPLEMLVVATTEASGIGWFLVVFQKRKIRVLAYKTRCFRRNGKTSKFFMSPLL